MLKRVFFLFDILWIALLVGWFSVAIASPDTVPTDWKSAYDQGVQEYEHGDYTHAVSIFEKMTKAVPECQEGHYYLAITLAQLNRFSDAREAYQNVIKLSPHTPAADLAREGLSYLPPENQLDAPPQFQHPAVSAYSTPALTPTVSDLPSGPGVTPQSVKSNTNPMQASTASTPQSAAQNPVGGMDPKTMEMMMMMSAMGGGSGGGFNPMMIPLMENMAHQNGSASGNGTDSSISPQMYSNMMMDQMMQNFNPADSGKND